MNPFIIAGILGIGASVVKHLFSSNNTNHDWWNSWSNSITGAHLTGAQTEANAFTANQARRQMDFQQQMRDTQYQSAVSDMQSAGLNPALMYGSGASGNSSPSGAMATSVQPSSPDSVGLIGQIANLALIGAQKRNLDSLTEKNKAETDLTKTNIVKASSEIQIMKANLRKLGLEGDALEIVNKYLDRKENVSLQNMTLQGDVLSAQWTEIQQKISNLKTDQLKTLQDIAESEERVRYLLSQESLNSAQVDEIRATISKINVERDNLVKQGVLTDKDIDFYEWNHGSDMVIAGQRTGTRYIPDKKFRDRNR